MKGWQWAGLGLALAAIGVAMTSEGDDMDLSKNFSLTEFTRSSKAEQLGISNRPDAAELANLRDLVTHVLQPARDLLGKPIRITSGFRSTELNKAVGGVSDSPHRLGEAADIKVDGMTAPELAAFLVRSGLPFDQVIGYAPGVGGHVHVSYRASRNRKETLWSASKGSYVPRVFV